jgi:hypothetical protein
MILGLQEVPRLEYGSLQVDLPRGEAFSSGARPGGNQSIDYAVGGQAAVATWNDAGLEPYTAIFPMVPHESKLELDTFFSSAQVNFMANNFTYYPNANRASNNYDMRLTAANGYTAQEAKSGGNRKLWTITIRMRVEVP